MSESDAVRLLAIIAAYDRRHVEKSTVAAWHSALSLERVSFDDAKAAVIEHFANDPAYLMPVHVVRGARRARERREVEARRQRALNPPPRKVGEPRPANYDDLVREAAAKARAERASRDSV